MMMMMMMIKQLQIKEEKVKSVVIQLRIYMLAAEEATQNRGAIQIIRIHFYGENLYSYGRTVKLGGLQPPASFSTCYGTYVSNSTLKKFNTA